MFEVFINLLVLGLILRPDGLMPEVVAAQSHVEYHLQLSEKRCVTKSDEPQRNPEVTDSVGVKISAQSALVVDQDTGKVLYEKNSHDVRSIASITKLMTALVALDYVKDLNTVVTIKGSDYRAGAQNYLMAGDQVKFKDVMYATLVASANEAAVALARSTGLSSEEFVAAMNKKAVALHMENTTFSDMTGLNNDNQSNAHDIVILLRTAMANTTINNIIGSKKYTFEVLNKGIKRNISSTDKILGQEFGIDDQNYVVEAGKTGYVEKAGYCFTSQIANKTNGQKIIVAVLGSDTVDGRFTDTKSLAYWVFKNYQWQ